MENKKWILKAEQSNWFNRKISWTEKKKVVEDEVNRKKLLEAKIGKIITKKKKIQGYYLKKEVSLNAHRNCERQWKSK